MSESAENTKNYAIFQIAFYLKNVIWSNIYYVYNPLDENNDGIIKSKAEYDENQFDHNSPSNSEYDNQETVRYHILW